MSGPEGTNGTRLVRVTEELFRLIGETATSEVTVQWGPPVEWVVVDVGDNDRKTLEPVFSPTVTRHFRDDLDDAEVGDGDSWT